MSDPYREPGMKWDGMCQAKKHGLDSPGQECDMCLLKIKPTMEELHALLKQHVREIASLLGPRASVIVSASFPLNEHHDRYAVQLTGPCLSTRGLLMWATGKASETIDSWERNYEQREQIQRVFTGSRKP